MTRGLQMAWWVVLMVVAFFRDRAEDERTLRETRRLLRRLDVEGSEASARLPEPPSPHQLLGDIARPLAPSSHECRSHGANRHCRTSGVRPTA